MRPPRAGLPLLVSGPGGCGETLVPDLPETTGRRFDPSDVEAMSQSLAWMAQLSAPDRQVMGQRAIAVVAE